MARWILLKRPEEDEIIERYGWPSEEAKEALFKLYTPLIQEWIPFYYRASNIDPEDIVQEALCEAWSKMDEFDPNRASLAIYLNIRLKPAMRDYLARMDGVISVPRSVVALGLPNLQWDQDQDLFKKNKLSPLAMAKLGRRYLSLQWPMRVSEPSEVSQYVVMQDMLTEDLPEGEVDPFLIELVEELPERERIVVAARLLGYSFDEIAMLEETPRQRRCSKQWVHKIWQRALQKLRKQILERDRLEDFDEYLDEEDYEEEEE